MYLPIEGIVTMADIPLKGWRRLLFFCVIGLVFMTLVDYIFAFLGIRELVYPILLLLAFYSMYHFDRWKKNLYEDWTAPHIYLFAFTLIFSIFLTSSGWMTSKGLNLRGINTYDSIWNIALVNELSAEFPPQHPGLSGLPLKGYHVFYNLWVSGIARFTHIDTVELYFHDAALFLSLLFVYSVYAIGFHIGRSTRSALWATFMGLFGGSFSYVIPIFLHQNVSIDDAFGITQPMSLLVSPSFISSLIILLTCFYFIDLYIHHRQKVLMLFVVMLGGVVVAFKVYAGMIILPIIGIFAFYYLITKRNYGMVLIFFGTIFTAMIVFLPLNVSYGFLRYQPLWPPHRVMQGPLGFTNWELKRQTLESIGASRGLLKLEIIAFMVFLFGNLGTRIIGICGIKKNFVKSFSPLIILLWLAIMVSFIIPMFFIQPIGAFNMIQLFWYFLVFVGIVSGVGISNFLNKFNSIPRFILGVVIILLTIPSAVEKLITYFPFFTKGAYISRNEYMMYSYIKNIGTYEDGVLYIPRLDEYNEKQLTQWFWGSSPPTISAFAHKRTFLVNEGVQFPYDEWIKPRIELISLSMVPQNNTSESETSELSAVSSLRSIQKNYNIRFILTSIPDPWFTNAPFVKKILQEGDLKFYEMLPL